MVGRTHREGVDRLVHLVEHLAEVVVFLGFRPADSGSIQCFVVDIADGDDLTGFPGILRVAASLAADADAGEMDLFDSRAAFARRDAAERPVTGAQGRRCLEKAAAIRGSSHVHTPQIVASESK
jgi:hypothetical protein